MQLNKGEALHALRRFLFFAHQGQVRRGQPEDQANQASCLNLVTNAVIAWNTVYMAAVIDRLKAKGGADLPRAARAPFAGPARPHQPVWALPVPGRPLGRQEALTTHQGVSHPANRSVGFCPFAIPRPDRLGLVPPAASPERERRDPVTSPARMRRDAFENPGESPHTQRVFRCRLVSEPRIRHLSESPKLLPSL